MNKKEKGFTLIELMVTVAVVGILASIAYPSYRDYVFRGRVVEGIQALSTIQTRMEQRFQDVGNYGTNNCAVANSNVGNFFLSCTLSNAGQSYLFTATGTGVMSGVSYSIDQAGTRRTLTHPKGIPPRNCWTIRGGNNCDY